jgi:hypothetical protein
MCFCVSRPQMIVDGKQHLTIGDGRSSALPQKKEKLMRKIFYSTLSLSLLVALTATTLMGCPGIDIATTYTVTIENLSDTQPLAPIVAATHSTQTDVFRVGSQAHAALVTMAETGNPGPLAEMLEGQLWVRDVHNVGMPLTRMGTTAGDFSDSTTFTMTGWPGDVFSMAGMLIATNDGFAGVDSTALPMTGTRVVYALAYDAGSEQNTELSTDLVDAATDLGSMALPDDPNGNASAPTSPQANIMLHPNVTGAGDLTMADHGWMEPVLRVTITASE